MPKDKKKKDEGLLPHKTPHDGKQVEVKPPTDSDLEEVNAGQREMKRREFHPD